MRLSALEAASRGLWGQDAPGNLAMRIAVTEKVVAALEARLEDITQRVHVVESLPQVDPERVEALEARADKADKRRERARGLMQLNHVAATNALCGVDERGKQDER